MKNKIKYILDDKKDILQKSKMYYYLCCGDELWNDFDESWINTWNTFYEQSWYVWSIVKSLDNYIWFVVSKDTSAALEYIDRNIWKDNLEDNLYKFDNNLDLKQINYIDWLYIYPEYRKLHIWSDLLKFHENKSKSLWYQYSMLEYNTYEKIYLGKFYESNGYVKIFDYQRSNKFDTSKTKIKTLMIKKYK